ncbi:MAG: PAS domain S-box protein, partial [Spartobacteria bacterium]|nr:PAS domain S-box protein [Spartobacteria bacterium]
MSEEEFYSSTMRIDISPDLMEQARAERMAADVNKRQPRTVIRIPKKAPMTTMGGQDFNELLQNIYDAVLITDMTGNINSVNVRAMQFFQYSRDDLCQRNILSVLSGADESLLTTITRTLENDRFVLIQAYCSCEDGSIFPAEISVNHLHLSTKVYLSFFIRDITLRKQAEEQLRTGYNAIQNSITGIAIADIEGQLGYCNPAFMMLLGLQTPEEAHTKNIRNFLCDEAYADVIIETILAGEAWGNELKMNRIDGTSFYVQLSVSTNLNPEGEVAGMVLSLVDITERILAQKQLEDYAQQLRAKNAEMEDDLNMARELEQAVMPTNYPVFPADSSVEDSALQFSTLYRPSGTVGGDFFDIRQVS